jgi:hypothetical protein
MRHLIRQLNEAAGRKYYVLVGWNAKMKRWEVIFSDYDRAAVEFEQDDQKQQRGMPDFEYKKMRILTVADAKRGTVDAAVAALKEGATEDRDRALQEGGTTVRYTVEMEVEVLAPDDIDSEAILEEWIENELSGKLLRVRNAKAKEL